jgi:LPS export ABC transporter protein LptC
MVTMRFPSFLLAPFCLLTLACASCEKESTAGTVKLDTLNLATHRSMNPVVHFMDSSRIKAVLKAQWAEVFDTRQETQMGGGLRVEFMDRRTGQRVSTLTADSAVIDDKTKNMTARGHVVVVSERPVRTVTTELMMWDNARQKLHSTAFVSVTSPEEILQGVGFESDQNLEHYTIYNVSGQTMLAPLGGLGAAATTTTANTSAVASPPQTSSQQPRK